MYNATTDDIAKLREGGAILAGILRTLARAAVPGISTAELDAMAETAMQKAGATPSFRGYRGYPSVICTSRNDHIVHGIPSAEERLMDGDVLGIDIGLSYKGRITDMAVTVGVGTVSPEAARLIAVTKTALDTACAFLRPGVTTGDLGARIQAYVEREGFSVIRDLVGHGVGKQVHEEPMIPNFGIAGQGVPFEEGMVIAVEPMVAAGKWQIRTLPDGWTVAMADGGLGAHFEHTLVVTRDGADVLTRTYHADPWP